MVCLSVVPANHHSCFNTLSILPYQIDAPTQAIGYPIPSSVYLHLKDIPEEARGFAFAKWVSSYYKHGDLSSRDFSQLNQREGDPSKKPTTDTIPLEELLTMIDFGPSANCETTLIDSQQFLSIYIKQTTKALFDPQIREEWGEHPVWCVYCEASIWNVHYTAWKLEEKVEASEINFKVIPGANHFVRRLFFLVHRFVQTPHSEMLFRNS